MRLLNAVLALTGLALTSLAAGAQTTDPIRIIVALGTGTPSDAVTRELAPRLSAILGQTVIVDNKPGANGVIAMQELMRSKPDGTTLLMGSVSPLAINMALVKNLPYDPRRDLTPIGGAYNASQAWVVKSSHPARTFPELIAYVKQRPGKVSVGHYSALTQIQVSALNKMAGIDLLPIPYKSTSTTYTDLLGGTVELTIMDMATALTHVKSGQARALGVSTLKRNPLTPDWPSVAETIPDYDFASWSAIVGPPGMPRAAVDRINAALVQTLKQKDVVGKLVESGLVAWSSTPEELKARIDAEVTKWTKLAREANIQPE